MKSVSVALLAGVIGCALALQFSAAATAQTEKVLHSFGNGTDGAYPNGVIDVKGTLYGTTTQGGNTGCSAQQSCGTAFSLDPKTGAEKVLYTFCSQQNCTDGSQPYANPIDVKGTLYGTTFYGGANCTSNYGCGTVFSLDPKTGAETVIYSFCNQQNCTDGETPATGLIDVKGTLYGTTYSGGTAGWGTVFALNLKSGAETVLWSFGNGTDGTLPSGNLIDVKGTLYSTTFMGGANCQSSGGCGTLFSLDLKTGAETVLYSFCNQQNCADGASPQAGLIAVKGTLYGTTLAGGAHGDALNGGTVFAFDLKTGTEKVLYSFCSQQNCADGQYPNATLIDEKGTLYGTTYIGGANCQSSNGCGTVFSLDPKTGAETVLYSFCSQQNCADGSFANESLVDIKGTLLSTTSGGGAYCQNSGGCGTAFSFKP